MTTINIGTAQELVAFAQRVNAGETTLDAELTANIDLTGVSWTPIGDSSHAYAGTFDGNGYAITIALIASADGYGIFGHCASVSIINLGVSGTLANGGYSNVAPIVGEVSSNGIITISKCFSDVSVQVTGTDVYGFGGIVGGVVSDTGATYTISDTYVLGTISSNGATGYYIGGIIGNPGSAGDQSYTTSITNCYVASTISGGSIQRVGGCVGVSEGKVKNAVTISNSVVVSSSISGSTSQGRFIGSIWKTPKVTNSYYNSALSAGTWNDNSYGTSTSEYNTQSFYESTLGFNFINTWYWDSSANLPKLRIFGFPTISSLTLTSPATTPAGRQITGTVTASGSSLTYQWYKSMNQSNWSAISGQTTANLDYTSTDVGTNYFKVTVSSGSATVDSISAGFNPLPVNVLKVFCRTNVNGVWKEVTSIYVNVGGNWIEADSLHVNVNGNWTEV